MCIIKMLAGRILTAGLTIVTLTLLVSCSSSPSLITHWKASDIIIDGKAGDWQTKLHEIPDQKIWVGFINDDKFLYMTLITEDRSKVMQMMRGGFITWFIPASNSDNTFGIKYPLSNKFNPREQMQNFNREMFQQGGGLDNLVKMFLEKQTEIQILNSDKYSLSLLPLENRDGIRAKLGTEDGKFIYELQVPLAVHDDFAFQIAALPGEDLKIKFETEQVEMEGMRSGMGGAAPEGGMRGSGQMRGNRPGGSRFTPSEPLNYSVSVKLSTGK